MANLGFRKTHISYEINDIKTALNVCSIDMNLLYSISLFTSSQSLDIPINLIFNYQKRNDFSLFGNGFNISFYKRIYHASNSMMLVDSDGEEYSFENGASSYYNGILESTISVHHHNQYTTYGYTDKYNNHMRYEGIGSFSSDYPDEFILSTGKIFNVDKQNNYMRFYDDSGCELYFEYTNNVVSTISYKLNNVLLYSASITYTNATISRIIEKKHINNSLTNYKIIKAYSFSYVNDSYSITDEINLDTLSFLINTSSVIVSKNNTAINNINIYSNYTKVLELQTNNYIKYIFDDACNIFSLESGKVNSLDEEVQLEYSVTYYRDGYDLIKHEASLPYTAISSNIDTLSTYTSSFTKNISGLTTGNSYILAFKYKNKATLSFGDVILNLPNRSEDTLALIGFRAQSGSITLSFSDILDSFYISTNVDKANYTAFKSYFYSDEENPNTTVRNIVKISDSIGDITYAYNTNNRISSKNEYGKTTTYAYVADTSLLSTSITNEVIEEYTYQNCLLTEHKIRTNPISNEYKENYTYQNNRLTSYKNYKNSYFEYIYSSEEDSIRKECHYYDNNYNFYGNIYSLENDLVTQKKYYNNDTNLITLNSDYIETTIDNESVKSNRLKSIHTTDNTYPLSYSISRCQYGINKDKILNVKIHDNTNNFLYIEQYSYNNDGNKTNIYYSNNTSTTITYNNDKLPSNINGNSITYDSNYRINNIGSHDYYYDTLGNITLETNSNLSILSYYTNNELYRRLIVSNNKKKIERYVPIKNNILSINQDSRMISNTVISSINDVLFSSFDNEIIDEFTNTNHSGIIISSYDYINDDRRYVLNMKNSIGYFYFTKTIGYNFETGLDINTTTISNNQLIFEVESNTYSNRYIRILISNGKIKLNISISSGDTYEYLTNLTLQQNTWQSLKLSVSEIEVYDDYYTFIYIALDNSGVGYQVTDTYFGNSKINLGYKFNYTKYKGLMKDFYIIPSSTDVTPNLHKVYKIKAINEYNKFNLLESHNITVNDKTYLKKEFIYYSDKMLVSQETFKINNVNYNRLYTYYPNGNINTITDNTFGNKTYIYDYLSRLLSDGNYIYSYNSRGDIISKGNISYSYDEFGRLTRYRGINITYNGTSLFPFNYLGRYIAYTRNKISGFYNDGSLSSPIVTYTYNERNLRNTKNVSGTITNYIYDGDLLITEYTNYRRIDYLYDDCDIIGFVYDNNPYFYIKDLTGVILGIVNRYNEIITKYTYSGFGSITSITGSNTTIGNLNPIRYKGYYYDTETGYYYLKSRFYDPNTCRFITPDSIDYLDFSDIRGLNLYAYCNNNPVMYSDGDGHMPKWLAWALSGAAVIAGVALSATGVGGILGGILIGAGAGSIINGYANEAVGGSFDAGYIGGAISGALCGVGAGVGGIAFNAAAKATGAALIGNIMLGASSSFVGGFAGNMAGVMTTAKIDGTFNDINWSKTAGISAAVGGLNVLAGIASGVGSIIADYGKRAAPNLMYIANIGKYTNPNIMVASRLVAGGIASATEGIFDVISYLIGLL